MIIFGFDTRFIVLKTTLQLYFSSIMDYMRIEEKLMNNKSTEKQKGK